MAKGASRIVLSRYHPLLGHREELLAAIAKLAGLATAGAGCYGARVFRSDQERDAVVAISRWGSEGAWESFARSPAVIEERGRFAHLLTRPAAEERFLPV